jgi:hypothetical protein
MAYATLAELKSYLGISGTSEDALLNTCLDGATAAIEKHTRRVFQAVSGTREYLYNGRNKILLDDDLYSLTSLKLNGVAVTEYRLFPVETTPKAWIVVYEIPSGVTWNTYEQTWSVAGLWGYSASPPHDIKMACLRWAGYLYRLKDAQVFDAAYMEGVGQLVIQKGIPLDVAKMLQPYVKVSLL